MTETVSRMSARGRADQDIELTILGDPLLVSGVIIGKGAKVERDRHRLGLTRSERDLGESLELLGGRASPDLRSRTETWTISLPAICPVLVTSTETVTLHILR